MADKFGSQKRLYYFWGSRQQEIVMVLVANINMQGFDALIRNIGDATEALQSHVSAGIGQFNWCEVSAKVD